MKSKNDVSLTYMGNLQQAWYATEVADITDINKLLQNFKNFGNFAHNILPLFFVIDYTAKQYLLMTDAIRDIAGYHPRDFLESGLDKLFGVFHKDDFKVFNQHIFTNNASFLKQTPQESHHEYVFSYNFRFVKQDKKFAHVLQRGSFITSTETGLPLYSFGMVMDITNLKTDSVMVQTIEKVNMETDMHFRELVNTNYYYPNFEDTLLTKREKIVLQYFSDGYSSKQVAAKLFLSEHTIVNHKQNMQRKTNTKNITELVAFAIRNRII